jgi:hypothetical protein
MIIGTPAAAANSGDWACASPAPPERAVTIRSANVVAMDLPFFIVLVRRVSYLKIPQKQPEKRLLAK